MKFKINKNSYSNILGMINVLLLVLIIVSCGKKSNNQGEEEFFLFDSSKLGIEVVDRDLGIQFYPPKDWNLRPSSISKKNESRGFTEKSTENFVYQPIYVFFNDSLGGLLSVGKILTSDSSLTKSARINYYKSLLCTKYKVDNLSSGNFIHSKIYFNQIRFIKHNLVSTKIFFENSNQDIIQFDYTVPSGYFENIDDYIKSSIGSIRSFQ